MDADELYELLPAVYRMRDASEGEPLRALVAVLAEQASVIEENLAQLYDDQFIETAADWVVPYIGDLIGYRGLYGVTPEIASPRAEVANTIGYRRRKGTASMLEQLARDVTSWDARVVEFFQLLATTQYMNHIRPENRATPDLRRWRPLADVGTPFDSLSHTADVRRISRARGRFNIPNIGVFLWRIQSYPHSRTIAAAVDTRRFRFSPLGADMPLYNRPLPEEAITHLARPENVPEPLGRRRLKEELAAHYGPGRAIFIERGSLGPQGRFDPSLGVVPVAMDDIIVCNLAGDDAGDWAHTPVPASKVAIDPVLGRVASGDDEAGVLLVTYRYGFSADIGGGEYERAATFNEEIEPVTHVALPGLLQDALAAGTGAVEVLDSGPYTENLSLTVPAGGQVEVRAANGARPAISLTADFVIDCGDGSEVTLNGLLIMGGAVRITGSPRRVRFVHCTLVPGRTLDSSGAPETPDAPSIVVEAAGVAIEIEQTISGGILAGEDATVAIVDSIIDALSDDGVAYAGLGGISPGGPLTVDESTIIGRVWTREMPRGSNAIFLARLQEPDQPGPGAWKCPVRVDQRQAGCMRFSYVPPGSRVPQRYRCQPADDEAAARVRPVFTSTVYGTPGYGQLSRRCAVEITAGADDGAEMGAYHNLFAAQRETNLRVRLDEYLRFGLEAGIFYAS